MMNNQMNYGMNQMMGGVQYNQQQAKMTQPLTKEEMAKLKNTGNAKLVVDELDLIRAKCTHKNNGQLALMQNNDGSHTCSICGATFNLVDTDPAEVALLTQRFIDVMQSIKTYYLDMPVNYATEFFVMIPLLANTPELYRVALTQFSKYESGSMVNQNNSMYGFNLFNTITSQGMPMYGQQPMMGQMPGMMPQQPMYGQPAMQQQPMYGQQPMMGYDAYGNPVQGMQVQGNPFTGQMPQQVQMQQPQQQNNGAQQQEQQNQNQVTTTKTFNV